MKFGFEDIGLEVEITREQWSDGAKLARELLTAMQFADYRISVNVTNIIRANTPPEWRIALNTSILMLDHPAPPDEAVEIAFNIFTGLVAGVIPQEATRSAIRYVKDATRRRRFH